MKTKGLVRFACALFALALFVLCAFPVQANEPTGADGEAQTENALQEADRLLDTYSPAKVQNRFFALLKKTFFGYTRHFFVLLFLSLMLSLLNAFGRGAAGDAATYGGEIVLCAYVFSLVSALCDNLVTAMQSLNAVMLSLLPVMTTLYGTSVGAVTAASSHAAVSTALTVLSSLLTAVVLPGVKAVIVLAAVTAVSKSFDFSGFSKCIRSVVMWIMGLVMCLLSATVFLQTALSVRKDTLALRTARYLASSLIPVVGGVVSESAKTVWESLHLVRTVSGTAGIFAIFSVIAAPIAALLVCRFFFHLAAAFSNLLGSGRAAAYLTGTASALDMLLGVCVGTALIFLILLGLFAGVSATA